MYSLIPRTLPEKGGRAGNDVHLQQPSSYLVLINETCNVKPECWYSSEHGCLGPQCGGGDTDCMYHYCGWDDHALGVEVLRSGEWKHWDLGNGNIEIWEIEVLTSGEQKYQDLGNRSFKNLGNWNIEIWEMEVSRSGKWKYWNLRNRNLGDGIIEIGGKNYWAEKWNAESWGTNAKWDLQN